MTIREIGEEIKQEFELFDDWMDKYNYIIELGRNLELISASEKNPENLINGCQSRVWVVAEYKNGKMIYKADSDAVITKGIVNLLIRALSGHTPKEIVETDLHFLDEIGLRDHLSPTRANGLNSMIKRMKIFALANLTKEDS
jgi:cysteine desulfuration protein SufE